MRRLTDCDKWSDPWFRRLRPEHKLFWLYICDVCDIAGIWKVDLEMAEFYIGAKLGDGLLEIFAGRIKDIGNERWFVIKFIEFQQGPELNPKNNCHLGIVRRLERLSIPSPVPVSPCQGATVGLPSPTSKSKGTSTSTGKSKEIGEVQEGKENKARPQSRQDVLDYVRSIGLPETDGHYCFDHWQGNGFRNSGKPILDWRATIRSWKHGNILPSLKQFQPSSFRPPSAYQIKEQIKLVIAARNKIYNAYPQGQIPEDMRRQMNELQKKRDQLEAQLTE